MPEIRPFRALRFDPTSIDDLAAVVAPPYDVIGPEEHARLLARHPANVVRLDLPEDAQGDEPDDRYRRAARTLAAWRSGGILRKDPHPSIYVYEQTYRVPGTDVGRTQRGFFARLRLEPFGPSAGVLPHERTLSGPKEDRYKLLRATGVNTSPVVGLYDDRSGAVRDRLEAWAAGPAEVDVADDDGTHHRLWAVPADGEQAEAVTALLTAAAAGPITIADGHHRYETALRYRDERRMSRSCEEDPAFDYLLMFFLPSTGEPLTVLPTHRVVRGLGDVSPDALLAQADGLFDVERDVPADELRRQFEAAALAPGGEGRFGLWTRAGGARLTARRDAFRPAADRRRAGRARARRDAARRHARAAGDRRGRRRGRRRDATRSRPPRRSTASTPTGTAHRSRSCSSRPRSPRSRPSRARATSCPRSRPTSTRRP